MTKSVAASGCRFRSFVHAVLVARFYNFARGLWRRMAREGSARSNLDALDAERANDPAVAAECREFLELLGEAVAALEPAAALLREWRTAGRSLRSWARQAGLGYADARHRWQIVFARLTVLVTQLGERRRAS